MPWQPLYKQFGSSNIMGSFKQSFKKAVDRVRENLSGCEHHRQRRAWRDAFPSRTLVPITAQTQVSEVMAKQSKLELSEDDISNVLEHIDYGSGPVAARRHAVTDYPPGYTQVGALSTRGKPANDSRAAIAYLIGFGCPTVRRNRNKRWGPQRPACLPKTEVRYGAK